MSAICKNCDADLHLDMSDTGPGGWLGTTDPKTTHPMDQNSLCCPGTQNEHEPEMESCWSCNGSAYTDEECDECEGDECTTCDGTGYVEEDCTECIDGEVEVER